jgi:transposase
MTRKTKEISPDQKRQVVRLHQDGFKKNRNRKIIGFSRSAVSKFFKRFDQRENIENKPRTDRPRSTSKHGERALIRLVKQDRRRNLRDLMNEFNQSVPVPICKRSIQRRLSKNGLHRIIVAKTLTFSLKNRKNRVPK